jgi:membrane protein involved in colicin uptake
MQSSLHYTNAKFAVSSRAISLRPANDEGAVTLRLTNQQVTKKLEENSNMGREQMRNLEIARIGATQVNEFEYQKQHGEMTEQEHGGQQGTDGKRLTQAQRVAQITEAAHKKVEQRRRKEAGKTRVPKTAKAPKAAKSASTKKAAKAAPAKKTTKAGKKK